MIALTKLSDHWYFLLAKKDYSKQELIDKALLRKHENQEIQETIESFGNYINDLRLTTNIWLFYSPTKGDFWIKQKMQKRKIKAETINYFFENNLETRQFDNLKQKIQSKYKIQDWDQIDWALKSKIFGYLARQGFANASELLRNWQE
jgi:SOS response regulatory protein OraA/RecX